MLQDKIKSLINIIKDTEINELEVSSFWGAQKIRLQKNINMSIQAASESTIVNSGVTVPVIDAPEIDTVSPITHPTSTLNKPELEITPSNAVEIVAPLVGTFYQSAKPGSSAFVKEGDAIEVGQIIGIIEAMKIFNEIEAEFAGKVVKIIANDSSPVEYGQALMLVEPN